MSDESDHLEFYEEIDNKKHDKIVEEVLNLNKIQNVKKPSRTEPTLSISEFSLVKSVTGEKGSVQLNALTKVLKNRKKHDRISKKIQLTTNKSETLPAPLEKPQADRIRRSINYEKTRLQLDRWEGLVTANRVAPQLVFPLNSTEKLKIIQKRSETFPTTWRIKSELQTELENLTPKVEEYHINKEEETFPLTLKELKERRKEATKLRARQSYKEAKARRQNKIKSKKYHRILRRENIKQKLKEFEELQKTNPEEALKKLEDIEKARAEERFSLRHKGTGQWARNKQIRAKYDKESRQVLAQQLTISRDLTQKTKIVDSDSEEDGNLEEKLVQNKDDDNPWISGVEPSKEVTDFVSGYRKYWSEITNKEKQEESKFEYSGNGIEEKATESDDTNKKDPTNENDETNETNENDETNKNDETNESKKTSKIKKPRNKKISINVTENKPIEKSKSQRKKRRRASGKMDAASAANWEISLLKNGNDVDDMFNKLEEKLEQKLRRKQKKIEKSNQKTKLAATKKKNTTAKIDLSLPLKKKRPIIDEQMAEKHKHTNVVDDNDSNEAPTSKINEFKSILDNKEHGNVSNIHPHKFMQVKVTNLSTAIPDILTIDENEENNSQREIILEAFEDDDIAEEFKKDKENEIKKDTPGDIDLNLPGWGSWGGSNIKPSKRKRRRFIIKMPKKIPRKDDNKGSLIINEKAQSKIKPHMVSELPFPFRSVKDYEASIRAPIGSTFVPETAFRRLIEPSVITKMGAIIEPITKSVLIGEKKV